MDLVKAYEAGEDSFGSATDACKEMANSCKDMADSCRELADSYKKLQTMATELLLSWERFKVQQAAATSSPTTNTTPPPTSTTPPPTPPPQKTSTPEEAPASYSIPTMSVSGVPASPTNRSDQVEAPATPAMPLSFIPKLELSTPTNRSTECVNDNCDDCDAPQARPMPWPSFAGGNGGVRFAIGIPPAVQYEQLQLWHPPGQSIISALLVELPWLHDSLSSLVYLVESKKLQFCYQLLNFSGYTTIYDLCTNKLSCLDILHLGARERLSDSSYVHSTYAILDASLWPVCWVTEIFMPLIPVGAFQ